MDHTKKIIIITAPSGAGKTSITRHLLHKYDVLSFSISATTRSKRDYEKDGSDYYFMNVEQFNQKIRQKAFVEWEMVYEGKYYGTLKSELERIWAVQKIPVLDIDVKGAIHIQERFRDTTLSIFIEPPSIEELKRRLISRGTETEKTLQDRISKASYEMSFHDHFNKIIVNDELVNACLQADEIVSAFVRPNPLQ